MELCDTCKKQQQEAISVGYAIRAECIRQALMYGVVGDHLIGPFNKRCPNVYKSEASGEYYFIDPVDP